MFPSWLTHLAGKLNSQMSHTIPPQKNNLSVSLCLHANKQYNLCQYQTEKTS